MPDDPLVSATLNRIKTGEDHHQTLVRGYDRSYEVYRAKRRAGQRRAAWESDLRVPYAMQIIDTELVNIIGGEPRAKVHPRHPSDVEASEAMQYALDYYVYRDHLAEKQVPFTQQGLIYGLTVAKNQWAYREAMRTENVYIDNPSDPYRPLRFEKDKPVTLFDGPTFEVWDIYDCWWEPSARDVQSAGYFVFRSWLSADELRAHARTEANPFGMFEHAAVEDLIASGPMAASTNTAQERYIGGSIDRRKDRYEILEAWTPDNVTTIGNRHIVLVPTRRNPYWHGQIPAVAAAVRPDILNLQGIPETDLIADLQEALWTVKNMRIDNMHATVHRGITYRLSGVPNPNLLVIKPRFRWGVQDHDDVKPFEVQQLPGEAYQEENFLKGDIQLVSGINPYVSGSDLNTVDQNTATGVTALQEVASRLLRFKARQLALAGYQRSFEQWVALTKQFLTEPMAVRIEGPGNKYVWKDLNPRDVVGDFDVAVEGTEESLSRQQERGEVMGLLNALAPFAQTGLINWQPILEKVASAFGFANASVLIQQQQQPQQQAFPVQGGQVPTRPGPASNGGPTAGGLGQQGQQQPMLDPRILQAAQQQGGMTSG